MSSTAPPAGGSPIPVFAPPAAPGSRWPHALATLLVVVAALLGLRWLHGRFALDVDDAYITYRYAQNLADGLGFVYNAGERVLGTTTPLYTLLLAGLARLGCDIPSASAWLNSGCAAASLGLAFHWLCWRTGRWLPGLFAVAALLSFGEFVLFSISGMETSLYLLLILLAFFCVDRGWQAGAAIAAGLCLLVRMDGAAVGAALVLHRLLAHRRLPSRGATIAFLAVVLPWFGFSLWYFGDVRPQSMLAKHVHAMVASRWWMLEFLTRPRVLAFVPLCLLALGWRSLTARGRPGVAALVVWGGFYAGAYTLYRIDLYRWYLAPMTVAIVLPAAFGFADAVRALWQRGAPRSRWRSPWLAAGVVVAVALLLGARLRRLWYEVLDAVQWTNTIERSRVDVVDHIVAHTGPGDVIATGAIGIVGWRTGAHVHDMLGLITRDAVGRSRDDNLQRSQARWYIAETATRNEAAPEVPGFGLVGRFARHENIAFLLYERADTGGATVLPAPASQRLVAQNGLALATGALSVEGLTVELTAARPVAQRYRVFVHVYRRSSDPGAPDEVSDFDPPTPTTAMGPGQVYTTLAQFRSPLQPGDRVRLGFFDDRDPAFPRLHDDAGRSFVEVVCPASPAPGGPPANK